MDIGRLKLMREATELLDGQLKSLGRSVLRSGGNVAMIDAKAHAEREYGKFDTARKKLRHAQADKTIAAIKSEQKKLSKRSD
jgi:hypothetical protein